MCPKTIWVKLNFKFCIKKAVGSNKSKVQRQFGSKSLGPTNFLGSYKKNWVKKKLWIQKFKKVGANKTLSPKICWVQVNKICILNYCTLKKIFGQNNVGPKIMITLYHFIMDHPVPFHYGSLCILQLLRLVQWVNI